MKLFKRLLIFLISLGSLMGHAKTSNLIGVGQGVSSPSLTSLVNFTSGVTFENPAGAVYQNAARLSLQYDKNGSSTLGGELGFGGNNWGIAGGYRKPDCDNCDGKAAGALAAGLNQIFSLGLRFEENVYGLGLILNHQGALRIGGTFDLDDSGGSGNKINRIGAGVSWVSSNWTLAVDASKLEFENSSVNSETIFITPGLMIRADIFQLSINYEMHQNDKNDLYKDDFWFGVGIGGQKWHLAIYSDYVNELALSGSLFF